MSIQKQQPYEPLTNEELREVEKCMSKHCKGLMVRVVSQLRQQEHNLQLQRAHTYNVSATLSQRLADILEDIEALEDTCDELQERISEND